jgi:hypothetical protein
MFNNIFSYIKEITVKLEKTYCLWMKISLVYCVKWSTDMHSTAGRRKIFFSVSKNLDRLWGQRSHLCNGYRWNFPREWSNRGGNLSIHSHLLPRLKIYGTLHYLPHVSSCLKCETETGYKVKSVCIKPAIRLCRNSGDRVPRFVCLVAKLMYIINFKLPPFKTPPVRTRYELGWNEGKGVCGR